MNEKIKMNWKLAAPWVTDQRGGEFTVTAKLFNMDSAREYAISMTAQTDAPIEEWIGVLRAFAAMIEQHTGTPASDPMAFEVRRLDG
jgi:hypothetical protein